MENTRSLMAGLESIIESKTKTLNLSSPKEKGKLPVKWKYGFDNNGPGFYFEDDLRLKVITSAEIPFDVNDMFENEFDEAEEYGIPVDKENLFPFLNSFGGSVYEAIKTNEGYELDPLPGTEHGDGSGRMALMSFIDVVNFFHFATKGNFKIQDKEIKVLSKGDGTENSQRGDILGTIIIKNNIPSFIQNKNGKSLVSSAEDQKKPNGPLPSHVDEIMERGWRLLRDIEDSSKNHYEKTGGGVKKFRREFVKVLANTKYWQEACEKILSDLDSAFSITGIDWEVKEEYNELDHMN